jgi:[ribosomal protein S18]-alanine N-acetyltransferase
MSEWRLDPWSVADARAVARLHGACFDDAWSAAVIRRLMDARGGFGFVVRYGRLTQGFVLCRLAGDDCEILTIGVAPRRRRHGVGARLLAAVLRRAAEDGAGRIVLEVAADNDPGRRFYGAHDFSKIGVRPGYYGGGVDGVDALVLARSISGS